MKPLTRFSLTAAIAAATMGVVAIAYMISGGAMFSPGPLNSAKRSEVARQGVHSHADLSNNCSSCHVAPWGHETMASRCQDCHLEIRGQIADKQPLHGKLADAQSCRKCHTEHNGPKAVLTSFSHFDHDATAFKLTGKHQTVTCAQCHADQKFQGTPQACVACHADPPVHKGKFGDNCASCHTTANWTDHARFDHNATAFKLTGKHQTVACAQCHIDQKFKGTAQSCVACHADPPVHKGKFGENCASCHTTANWTDHTRFDHNLTAFKLTGKHQTVACAQCHIDQKFKGTAQSCVACHADPPVHKGKFGENCASCHSTATWKGATFDHEFPLNHGGGRRRNQDCTVCHPKQGDYKSYTCYGCHEHQPAKIERKHRRVPPEKLEFCFDCHTGGHKRRERRERQDIEALIEFLKK